MKISQRILKRLSSLAHFPASEPFFKLKSVKWTFWSIVLLSLGVYAGILIFDWPGNPSFTAEAVNNWYSIFKVPLGILGILIPALGVLAIHHRSVQSAENMRLAEAQNVLSNHFKNKEELKKHLENVELQFLGINFGAFYEKLFPESREGKISAVDDKVVRQLRKSCEEFVECVSAWFSDDNEDYQVPLARKVRESTVPLKGILDFLGGAIYVLPKSTGQIFVQRPEIASLQGFAVSDFLNGFVDITHIFSEVFSFVGSRQEGERLIFQFKYNLMKSLRDNLSGINIGDNSSKFKPACFQDVLAEIRRSHQNFEQLISSDGPEFRTLQRLYWG